MPRFEGSSLSYLELQTAKCETDLLVIIHDVMQLTIKSKYHRNCNTAKCNIQITGAAIFC